MTLTTYPDLSSTAERFLKYADVGEEDACWKWTSTLSKHGYGKFWLAGAPRAAHRVSHELFKGPIPAGMMIRHTCDNKPCVNPSHLIVGTVLDNARDAVERGRYRRGSANGRAKLSAQQVSEIRQGRLAGETQAALASRFGVSKSAIQWILNGRNWRGVGDAS